MAFESEIMRRIKNIEQHSLIKESKGLQKQLAGLKNAVKHDEEISRKYSYVVELMADGVEYTEAEIIAGLRKRD